ncbi:MAG: Ig-like domain-containing protein [Pseudomonadota bacterium]
MTCIHRIAQRALIAALVVLPFSAQAGIRAKYHPATGDVIVTGLGAEDRHRIADDIGLVRLQLAGDVAAPSMLLTVKVNSSDIQVRPRFKLTTGRKYALSLRLINGTTFDTHFDLPERAAANPKVVSVSPARSPIPANTLRIYIAFSEPMARDQVRNAISLIAAGGEKVPTPFLNLNVELWDKEQRRLTLLFDPGRIKQGVGPNNMAGSPLQSGHQYTLFIAGSMKSAAGVEIGKAWSHRLVVGPSERRALAPRNWRITRPKAGSTSPLILTFNREMDSGSSLHFLRVVSPTGQDVPGSVETDGATWSLRPHHFWRVGTHWLEVSDSLEDVAGNTVRSPFDAKPEMLTKRERPVLIPFKIQRPRKTAERSEPK